MKTHFITVKLLETLHILFNDINSILFTKVPIQDIEKLTAEILRNPRRDIYDTD